MMNEYKVHAGKIYNHNSNLGTGRTLFDEMIKMAENAGNTSDKSVELTNRIMDTVKMYDSVWNDTADEIICSGNAGSVLDQMFEKLMKSRLTPQERMEVMRQMLNGFTQNDFEPVIYSPEEEEKLQNDLKAAAEHLHISSEALKKMKKRILKNREVVATAEYFREESFELKCLTAMELYLTSGKNGEQVAPEIAALNTCKYVDLEALADGARVGGAFETTAKILMAVLSIVVAICAVAIIMELETTGAMLFVMAAALGYMDMFNTYGEAFARQIGKLAASGIYRIKGKTSNLEEGFDRMAEMVSESQGSTYVAEDDDVEYVESGLTENVCV